MPPTDGQALELENIAPQLISIVKDDAVMQRAQKRARHLIQRLRRSGVVVWAGRYRQKYKEDPSVYPAQGYTAVWMLALGLKASGDGAPGLAP